MNADRVDYIKRLIAEIREQISEDPDTINARAQFGEDTVISRWLNIELLCMVIETDVLGDAGDEV